MSRVMSQKDCPLDLPVLEASDSMFKLEPLENMTSRKI